ncbi:MAG: L-threonylcarbamoyladenylate synthase [Chthoniobacteraceae bacterium]
METIVAPAGDIARAVELLRAGEVVALPTETVYGLAADATRADAVVKIFEAKERPLFDPLIVHLPDASWLGRVARHDDVMVLVEDLTQAFWPGPLTLVLPRWDAVPDIVTSGLDTIAVRMSAHPVFREICRAFGKPLAAPSANRFGRISPTCAGDVVKELGGRIPLVVDGGPTEHGLESTIVRVEPDKLTILRAGPITREELETFAHVSHETHGSHESPQAPGQLASHYAPRTPLTLETRNPKPETRTALLAFRAAPKNSADFAAIEILSPTGDLREAAATLFAKLRRLDEAGLDLIVAESVPEHGLGVAIMDRLRKAAARE